MTDRCGGGILRVEDQQVCEVQGSGELLGRFPNDVTEQDEVAVPVRPLGCTARDGGVDGLG